MPDLNFSKKAIIKVQERSAFDKSFRNLLTTKCGTITPILCDEVIPNTTVNLRLALNCTLPPLASETFMNVNLKAEAFFCPTRLLMQGFDQWIQGNVDIKVGTTANPVDCKLHVPLVQMDSAAGTYNTTTGPYIGPGSLMDYLGFRVKALDTTADYLYVNMLPLLCYHFICDEWYKNLLVQQTAFYGTDFEVSSAWSPGTFKYKKPMEGSSASAAYLAKLNYTFRDGVKLGELRQCNFGADYFTMATPSAQKGSPQKVTMELPYQFDALDFISGSFETLDSEYNPNQPDQSGVYNHGDSTFASGSLNDITIGDSSGPSPSVSFTISSLRAANSLQQWCERSLLANSRYVDFLKVHFNADLKDSVAQRPIYLGSASFPVYSKGIYQTASDGASTNNPFDSVASRYGHAYSEGTDFIIDHFTAEEPGYIMVMVRLVPEATYASGVNKYFLRYFDAYSYGEMATPILQNVGQEPINTNELDAYYRTVEDSKVFGYTDRFSSWMTRQNELHGLMRDGQSLESFALQRTVYGGTGAGAPVTLGISSDFLGIPVQFMDQVTAVDQAISQYGVWIDSWLDYKVVMPLGKYVIPSLQDPAYEHGDTVVVNKRGRYLD